MAVYKLVSFAGNTLPIYNVQIEMPLTADSPVIRTVNGYYDVRGTRRLIPTPAYVRMRAIAATADTATDGYYLIVNAGNRLVLHNGDPLLIVAQSQGQVRQFVDRLRGLIGVRGTLTRQAFQGEPSAAQTIDARLLGVDHRPIGQGLSYEEISMQWEAIAGLWDGAAGSASGLVLTCSVGGNAPVRDARLTLTGTNAATHVTGVVGAANVDWSFPGTGQTLVVTGFSATANGAATSVTLNPGHTAETLIELAPAAITTLTVTGAATATLTWNEKWA